MENKVLHENQIKWNVSICSSHLENTNPYQSSPIISFHVSRYPLDQPFSYLTPKHIRISTRTRATTPTKLNINMDQAEQIYTVILSCYRVKKSTFPKIQLERRRDLLNVLQDRVTRLFLRSGGTPSFLPPFFPRTGPSNFFRTFWNPDPRGPRRTSGATAGG